MAISEHASKQYDLDLDSIRSRVLPIAFLMTSLLFTWMPKWATGSFGPVWPSDWLRARLTGGSGTSNLAYPGRDLVGPCPNSVV